VTLHRAGEFPAAKVPKRYVMSQRATELFVDDVTGGAAIMGNADRTALFAGQNLHRGPTGNSVPGPRGARGRAAARTAGAAYGGRSCLADPELGAAVLGASRTLTGGDHYLEETVRTRKDVQRARTRPLSRVNEKRTPRARATVNQLSWTATWRSSNWAPFERARHNGGRWTNLYAPQITASGPTATMSA
jgi:hypothetical protein